MDHDEVEEFLEHHGIKGMKWGVRRANTTARLHRVADGTASKSDKLKTIMGVGTAGYGGAIGYKRAGVRANKRDARQNKRTDKKFVRRATDHHTYFKAYNRAAEEMNNGGITRFNNKPQYKGKNLNKEPLRSKYYQDYANTFTRSMQKALDADLGNKSESGNYKTIVTWDNHAASLPTINVVHAKPIKHADTPAAEDVVFRFVIGVDANGKIVSTKMVDMTSDLTHEDGSVDVDAFLEHYGIKGMHWGVRKATTRSAGAPEVKTSSGFRGAKVKVSKGGHQGPSEDAIRAAVAKQTLRKSGRHALTNKEMQDLVTRLNLEQQLNRLTEGEGNIAKIKKGNAAVKTLVDVGKTGVQLHSLASQTPQGKKFNASVAKKLKSAAQK